MLCLFSIAGECYLDMDALVFIRSYLEFPFHGFHPTEHVEIACSDFFIAGKQLIGIKDNAVVVILNNNVVLFGQHFNIYFTSLDMFDGIVDQFTDGKIDLHFYSCRIALYVEVELKIDFKSLGLVDFVDEVAGGLYDAEVAQNVEAQVVRDVLCALNGFADSLFGVFYYRDGAGVGFEFCQGRNRHLNGRQKGAQSVMYLPGKAPALPFFGLDNCIQQCFLLVACFAFHLLHVLKYFTDKKNSYCKKQTGDGSQPGVEQRKILGLKICYKGEEFSQALNGHKDEAKGNQDPRQVELGYLGEPNSHQGYKKLQHNGDGQRYDQREGLFFYQHGGLV